MSKARDQLNLNREHPILPIDIPEIEVKSNIHTPIITNPVEGETNVYITVGIEIDGFYTEDYVVAEYAGAEIIISTDPVFSNIVYSEVMPVDNSYNIPGLLSNTSYYTKIRLLSEEFASEWSEVRAFTTMVAGIYSPILSIEGDPSIVLETPVFFASAFNTFGTSDSHLTSSWVIRDLNGGIIWESLNDVLHKTSIEIPIGVLTESTKYTMGVIYYGATLTSRESFMNFETSDTFLETPQLSGPSETDENTQITVNIDNYNPLLNYTIQVSEGVIYQIGSELKWTLDEATANHTAEISLTSSFDHNVSPSSLYSVIVIDILVPTPILNYSAVMYENSTENIIIVNYDVETVYAIDASLGAVTKQDDVIIWDIPYVNADTPATFRVYGYNALGMSHTATINTTIINIPEVDDLLINPNFELNESSETDITY